MKIRTVGLPILTFILGGAIVAGVFLERVIPNLNSQLATDVAFVDLGENQGKYSYSDILWDYQLARTYLWNTLYFYKKDKGLDMLRKLAAHNYTPAAISLALYHEQQMAYYVRKHNPEKAKEHFDKLYYWANLAAQQGNKSALLMLVRDNPENLQPKDLAEDLKILDEWAEQSPWSTPAYEMSKYHEVQGNKEKAEKFDALYVDRLKNPRPDPVCTTITPWRGL